MSNFSIRICRAVSQITCAAPLFANISRTREPRAKVAWKTFCYNSRGILVRCYRWKNEHLQRLAVGSSRSKLKHNVCYTLYKAPLSLSFDPILHSRLQDHCGFSTLKNYLQSPHPTHSDSYKIFTSVHRCHNPKPSKLPKFRQSCFYGKLHMSETRLLTLLLHCLKKKKREKGEKRERKIKLRKFRT